MFSLEHELKVREDKIARHDECVAIMEEKHKEYQDAVKAVEDIGDISELESDIEIIKGYLGTKEVCAEPDENIDGASAVEESTAETDEVFAEQTIETTAEAYTVATPPTYTTF